MNSVDLSKTIAPKSDQLNADDMIGGPMTITVTEVRGHDSDEQPISIRFEGDSGKPYKPCKSMRRVLVHCWGKEGADYVGKRMTLFCDPNVQFGGIKTGGIRISHLSHIERPAVIPLMVTRGQRKPYEVKPLRAEVKTAPQVPKTDAPPLSLSDRAAAYEARMKAAPNTVKLTAIRNAGEKLRADLDTSDPERLVELEEVFNTTFAALQDAERAEAQA